MQKAIVIGTTPDRYKWLNNLLETLHGYANYPVLISNHPGYEIGKIEWMVKHTDIDEFFFLQDSVEVKDPSLFTMAFESYEGQSVSVDYTMRSFLVKYRREVLLNMDIPKARTKIDAVDAEDWMMNNYLDNTVYLGEFNKSNAFEYKFDRNNMVLENKWLKKYKSIWSRDQLS